MYIFVYIFMRILLYINNYNRLIINYFKKCINANFSGILFIFKISSFTNKLSLLIFYMHLLSSDLASTSPLSRAIARAAISTRFRVD